MVDELETVEKNITRSGVPKEEKPAETGPSYKVIGDTKVPVSKSHGKLWKSRKDQAMQKRRTHNVERAWNEAIKYYRNDQLEHRRDADPDRPGNDGPAARPNKRYTETENIVFANVSSLVPILYAKNPTVESSVENKEFGELARATEHLVNALFAKKPAPGINLKPKMRKAVVSTTLMNMSWIEVGYTQKEFSSEQALEDLQKLSMKLENAKTPQEIEETEGELMALEASMDMLTPSGPWAKFVRPQQILRDPNSKEEDCSDCNWLIKIDYLPTNFINAMYGEKNEKGEVRSIYEPTFVLAANADATDDTEEMINNFTLFDDQQDYEKAGFDTQESYDSAKYTRVCYVWDKVTQRVLLYSDEAWTWPIWVWDDPYNLDTFFPYFPLSFHTDPERVEGKGETTYYLDQQDAINEMNDEERRIRQSMKHNIAYNADNMSPEQAEELVNHNRRKPVGMKDVPEGMRISDLIETILPPSINLQQMFNTDRKLQAIDRIASTSNVIRGAEYKTNTTNLAIQSYEASSNTRLDEKLDAIEDVIGSVGWAVGQLCLQFMDAETVQTIIGDEKASGWRNLSVEEIRKDIHIRIVGGSTSKPTSGAKKQEALQLGQILGQYASGSPAAIMVALKTMEQAFDEVIITEEDWQMIMQSIQAQMQQGQQQQGGQPQQQGGGIPPQVAQLLQSLPPEIQQQATQAIQQAVSQGVPPEQAVQQVVQTLTAQQQPS